MQVIILCEWFNWIDVYKSGQGVTGVSNNWKVEG